MNIKYYKNSQPLGSPRNWNNAIQKATGEFIKLLHHDDWFCSSTSLASFVSLLETNKEAVFGFSASQDIVDGVSLKKIHTLDPHFIEKLKKDPTILFLGNKIGAPSVTIFRASYNQIYDENLKWLVDVELYIRCLIQHPQKFAYTNDLLVSIGIDGNTRVTNSCIGNGHVELFEYTYVYQKLSEQLGCTQHLFLALWNLFLFYEIKSVNDLKKYYFLSFPDKLNSHFSKIIASVVFYKKVEYVLYQIWRFFSPLSFSRITIKAFYFSRLSITTKKSKSLKSK